MATMKLFVLTVIVACGLSSAEIETTSDTVENNYQLCFELKDLHLSNIAYHSRNSIYGQPSAQVHLFDPSLSHPSIRSFDIKLHMSKDPNVTHYEYNDLNNKFCWIDTKSTQLYFDFELFQYYHVAMRVGYLLNTGLNGSGLEKKDFKFTKSLNLTSSNEAEYRNVIVYIKYKFELKLLSNEEYQSLLNGNSQIDGSMTAQLNEMNMNQEVADTPGTRDTLGTLDTLDNADNAEFSELDVSQSGKKSSKNSSSSDGSSSGSTGMIVSAIVAALMGFIALIGVIIYLYKMYSRKDYTDMDKETRKREKGGTLKRISLRDTANKLKDNIVKTSISLQENKNIEYEVIGDANESNQSNQVQPSQLNYQITHASQPMERRESSYEEDGSIDVSIVTNESQIHGLP